MVEITFYVRMVFGIRPKMVRKAIVCMKFTNQIIFKKIALILYLKKYRKPYIIKSERYEITMLSYNLFFSANDCRTIYLKLKKKQYLYAYTNINDMLDI